MLRKTLNAAAVVAKLGDLAGALRIEADKADLDSYDEAMLNAVLGLIETAKVETAALGGMETQFGKLARRA